MSLKFDASNFDFNNDGSVTTGSFSWRQSGMYFGVGIGRNITQSFSLILAFDRYSSNDTPAQYSFGPNPDINLNWIGFEAEYRF
jgi:long-subunit fatty acid transport protein